MNKCVNILIVEDDEGIREALRLMLEYSGYHVSTASNGKEALEKLPLITRPCLILLDLMMPVMSGWDFAEAIGKDVGLARIPVVVVTAVGESLKTPRGIRALIKKPIDTDLLMNVVKKYCEVIEAG